MSFDGNPYHPEFRSGQIAHVPHAPVTAIAVANTHRNAIACAQAPFWLGSQNFPNLPDNEHGLEQYPGTLIENINPVQIARFFRVTPPPWANGVRAMVVFRLADPDGVEVEHILRVVRGAEQDFQTSTTLVETTEDTFTIIERDLVDVPSGPDMQVAVEVRATRDSAAHVYQARSVTAYWVTINA